MSSRLPYFLLVVLYLVWGTTFLSIRIAVETIPPMYLVAIRNLGGGGLLFLGMLALNRFRCAWPEMRNAILVGTITAGLSNGAMMMAGKSVDSGVVAITFSLMPFFMLLLNWFMFERVKPTLVDFFALVVGLAGTAMVLTAGRDLRGTSLSPSEIFFLVSCPLLWAFGALLGRRLKMPKDILLSASHQMLGGGFLGLVLGLIVSPGFSLGTATQTSLLAAIYLSVFGSLLGYAVFAYLIQKLNPQVVATYAFVNPIVAVFLGIAFGERLTSFQVLFGAALALSGVALRVGMAMRRRGSAASNVNAKSVASR